MYYGTGGMGTIPVAMRDYCVSFNGLGENYTGQSFRIAQDVWVSPSNGVKYIGNDEEEEESGGRMLWELRAGKKSLGKYHRLVISHNGKCADRIMSRTPAKAFHSLLRTKFAPYVPQWGGNQMTLNSIYSLTFAVKNTKSEESGGNNGGLSSSIAKTISQLSNDSGSKNDDVYTVMIKNEPNLRLLSCNTLKHHHERNANSESDIEVYTLLSSSKFGKKFKGPQENLPEDLVTKVTLKLLDSLESSLDLEKGSVTNSVVDLKLQLWGAAVPMNIWTSTSNGKEADGYVYDAKNGVGACGDWILESSVAGAWESGRRLANWILTSEPSSVGLPDRNAKDGGKFVPSLVALGAGIGAVPTSPNLGAYEFPTPNEQQQSNNRPRGGGPSRSKSPRRNNGAQNNNRRRSNNNASKKGSRPSQPVS